jgi:hypothetical protein
LHPLRWFTTACLIASGVGLALVAPAQAAVAGPALDVPAEPAGDVGVVATADPASWPYVQVKLARVGTVAPPYESLPAIDPAPVTNPGGGVDLTVPTWGLDGVVGTFVLLGCTTGEATTCSTLLATDDRTIVQTAAVTASFGVPEQPVFVPEEQVGVDVQNAGGGEMRASLTGQGAPGAVVLPGDGTVPSEVFPDDARTRTLQVRRCSALASSAAYCEPVAASQVVSYVREVPVHTVFDEPRRLTLDPAWHGSRTDVLLYTTPLAHRSTWSLYDGQGQQVLDPVEVQPGSTGLDELTFNPGAEAVAQGVELADGVYTARFSVTGTKGELTRTGTEDVTVELLADPPADEPEILAAHRVWRDGHRLTRSPYLEVASYPGSWERGLVRLRNAHGRVVDRTTVGSPCLFSCDPWRLDFDELFGSAPRPGRYGVELTAPDSWGRMAVMRLGQVEVQRLARVEKTVVAGARAALVSRHGDTRVYELRVPSFRALDRVELVDVDVDPTSSRAEGPLAARIPRLGREWLGGSDLDHRRGTWREVRTMGISEALPSRIDLQGGAVQVRVQGDPDRSRIARVRLQVHGYAWRSPAA